ncbi:MAG: FAD-dependent oxidoreductase [Bdellovibrionota bacterium]
MELSAVKNIKSELLKVLSSVEDLDYVENCEAFSNRVLARVMPKNMEECLLVLKIAREYQCAIYPVSTGKNWGFGASVPTDQDCILLNLKNMNDISEYDPDFGTVKIQAGVTQKQLQLFLEEFESPYRIDVTGSGEETSVLGNALERGLGYQALRHEHLLSLKVLLIDGTVLETGYARFPHSSLKKMLAVRAWSFV